MDKPIDYTAMSDAELEAENGRLSAERGDVEQRIAARQAVLSAEVTRRADIARMEALAGSMTDDDRAALAAHLAGEG